MSRRTKEPDREIHTRTDLDRSTTIYSLEFTAAELHALQEGIVLDTVQRVIRLVLNDEKIYTRTGEPAVTPASQLPRRRTEVTR